jgi:hypothetical protein
VSGLAARLQSYGSAQFSDVMGAVTRDWIECRAAFGLRQSARRSPDETS